MRDRYKITQKDGIHFLTSTIVEFLPVFTSSVYFQIIIESFKHCQRQKGLKIFGYVIMDNHFHLVAAAEDLSAAIGALRRFTATAIINQLKTDNRNWLLSELAFYKKKHKVDSDYQVWQEGLHPILIQSQEMLNQKIEYGHFNPIRRGLVDLPEQWRYSSARNYLGDHSIIRIDELPA
jgi:REP element-mobilizing transposase RayT